MEEINSKFTLPNRFKLIRFKQFRQNPQLIDLGNGSPDYPPPNYHHITEILAQVAQSENPIVHQYPRDIGHTRLVAVLAKLYSRTLNHQLDPFDEILTTVGAQEALFSTITGHVDTNDEVIIFEPFSENYELMVLAAEGVPKFVPLYLHQNTWIFDTAHLQQVFNPKTKLIILNNPHESTGKVFKLDELEFIADLCKRFNVLCVADEAYEWVVYEGEHVKMATLRGMWERTITVGSAGKMLSVDGWRIGWAYGPSNLLHNLRMVHQNMVCTGNAPMQEAIAIVLEQELELLGYEKSCFNLLKTELEARKVFLSKVLVEAGLTVPTSEAGYFLVADWSCTVIESDQNKDICDWIAKNLNIFVLSLSEFYSEDHKYLGKNLVRLCFFKRQESLMQAAAAFQNL